jgi:asparagine synthase (glutamine-hydrolysing)
VSGIVGIVNLDGAPVDRELLQRMTDFMAYRGPDGQAVLADGPVGFGHAMFRTTWEAETERQPMSLDGQVWLTADVRVDSRAELIAKLEARGRAEAKRANDAELILHAYHAWGEDCLKHLIGDFAFAVWNSQKRRLFCARDQMGVKPFYYAHCGQSFVFGNTLQCLRLHPAVSAELNDLAIADFLLFGENQDVATTSFRDIMRLPPAHRLVLSSAGPRAGRYWSLPTDFHLHYRRRPDGEIAEEFRQVLRVAVKDRLRTDRVAVELSGGLDSTSVAATTRELLPAGGAIRACCVSYARLIPDREKHFADIAASALGIPIDHVIADDLPLFQSDPEQTAVASDPAHVDPFSPAISRASFALMAAHSRVALTGWDGDTLMTESPRHYLGHLLRAGDLRGLASAMARYLVVKKRLPPIGLRTTVKRLLGRYPVKSTYPSWLDPSFEARLGLRQRWRDINVERPKGHPTRPYAFHMFSRPNLPRIFEGYDAALTDFPLEARHPILDVRVIESLLRLPPVPWCIEKHVARVAMRGWLPPEILTRPKSGLAGDPAVALARDRAVGGVDKFEMRYDFNRYVRRDAVPAIAGEKDVWALWTNLRPYTLSLWMDTQKAAY